MCVEKLNFRNHILSQFISCLNGHCSVLSNNAEHITLINACIRSIFLNNFDIRYHTDIPRFELEGYSPVFKTKTRHFREIVDLIDHYVNYFRKKEEYERV